MFLSFGWLCLALLSSICAGAVTPPQEPLSPSTSSAGKPLHLTDDLLGFHKNLTQIESITGNEYDVGEWLISNLKSQGYNAEKQHVDKHRFNVHAWPGATRDAEVLVTSHIDTVPPFWPYKIHKTPDNTTIHGRGSVDAKGSVAVQVLAVNALLSSGKISADDVALLFVVGEETGGDGMRAANDLELKPKTIIFGEPTEGKLAAGHKGNLGFTVKAKGKAAHSGYPWLGRSANEVLIKALSALMELESHLPTSEKYGITTVNIGRIEGGVAANVVAETAEAKIAIRIAGGTPADIKMRVKSSIEAATSSFLRDGEKPDDVVVAVWSGKGYGPIDIDHDVPGFDTITVNYGTDVPNLDDTVKGQKRYLYGPGSILVAHSDHEALTVDQLEDAVEGYKKLILHALEK